MASDMEVQMKQRCVTDFLHVENSVPTDIHQCLLKVSGDQPVDVSTVRKWVGVFQQWQQGYTPKHIKKKPKKQCYVDYCIIDRLTQAFFLSHL